MAAGKYNFTIEQGATVDFKIYNRVLSDSEITQNYNALKSRFGIL